MQRIAITDQIAVLDSREKKVRQDIDSTSKCLLDLQVQCSKITTVYTEMTDLKNHMTALREELHRTALKNDNPVLRRETISFIDQATQALAQSKEMKGAEGAGKAAFESCNSTSSSLGTDQRHELGAVPMHEIVQKSQGAGSRSVGRATRSSDICSHRTRQQSRKSRKRTYTHQSTARSLLGTFVFRSQTVIISLDFEDDSTAHFQTTVTFMFHPASWILRWRLSDGIAAAIKYSTKGWDYNVSPVRAVPDDSLIFDACKKGNLETVRLLFDRNEASVLDSDSDGLRPLNVRFLTPLMGYTPFRLLLVRGIEKVKTMLLVRPPRLTDLASTPSRGAMLT